MEKVLVYPFDRKFAPCIRYQTLLEQYEICRIVSPPGWGLSGKDAGIIDGGSELGLIIQDNFSEMLNYCDTVFLVDSYNTIDFESLIQPKINEAIKAKKNIVSLIPIVGIDEMHVDKKNYLRTTFCQQKSYTYQNPKELAKIFTPIIAVIGLASQTNKFNTQLALRKEIQELGYKVSQIGSRRYCEIFGFHSFPDFIYNASIPETEKVKSFNRFIKEIENQERPDVIILGIPGGIMSFNDQIHFDFGILSFEIFQSIHVDTIVLNLFCEQINQQYLDELNNLCRYRFGTKADCFNLSHQSINWMEMRDDPKQIDTCTINISQTENLKLKYVNEFKMPIFDSINSQDARCMANLIINKLQSYSLV